MDWKTIISEKSMDIVVQYEELNGRKTKIVNTKGVGYDILSEKEEEQRFIEVKATSESWKTYNWLPLYYSEVNCLNEYPDKFYLYIIKFNMDRNNRNKESLDVADYEIFIINGTELLENFKIKPETYSLSPVSQRKLTKYMLQNNQ
jgi:hypothetical protein